MSPSARYARQQPDRVPRFVLLDDDLVECPPLPEQRSRPMRFDVQHEPLVEMPTPVVRAHREPLQRIRDVRRFDLGEVTELTEVDAEQRHGSTVEGTHGPQHRAVAAETQDDVGRAERSLADMVVQPELGAVVGEQPPFVVVLRQPRHRLLDEVDDVGALVVRADRHRRHRSSTVSR
jgi:hypothetical protein